jgi:hypothetical protein
MRPLSGEHACTHTGAGTGTTDSMKVVIPTPPLYWLWGFLVLLSLAVAAVLSKGGSLPGAT